MKKLRMRDFTISEQLLKMQAKLVRINIAREEAGLPHLSAKVRKCIQCGEQFASIESRTCDPCLKKRESE